MASCKNCGHEVEHFEEGGGVPPAEQSNAPDSEAPPQAPVVVNVGTQAPPAPASVPAPAAPLAPAAVKPPAPSLAPPQAAPPDPNAPTDFKMPQNVQDSINAPSPMQSMQQMFQQHKDAHMADLVDGDQKFENDLVNGHITPKTYQSLFADKSTLGKIGSIFGLLIGGAGSGLAHQQNALLAAWDKQISNDLEAQKQSKANAQNFLRINQADLANKANSLGGIENAKAMAVDTTKKQMVQVSYHKMLEDIKKLPPAQQPKARHLLMILHPEMLKVLGNANDLMSSAAATQGMSNPLDQAPPSGQPKNGQAPQSQNQTQPGAASGKGAAAKPDYSKDHILQPGASNSFTTAQYDSRYNDDKGEVKDQLEKASQADKAIDMINKHFPQMVANVKNIPHPSGSYQPYWAGLGGNNVADAAHWIADKASDTSGFIHQQAENLSAIPYGIGDAISGLGKTLTPTDKNKDYDIHRDAAATAMANVLTNSGLTPTAAQSVINDYMPVTGDSTQIAKTKLKTAIEKMKAAVTTTALDRHHLTRNPQK